MLSATSFQQNFDPNLRTHFVGHPVRPIFNSSSFLDPANNVDMIPKILMNPVPYGFIEMMRRGTGILNSFENRREQSKTGFFGRLLGRRR